VLLASRLFHLLNAIYHGDQELADIVADFLAEGLRKSERCWYLPASGDARAIRAVLKARRIDAKGALERGALRILSANVQREGLRRSR